MKPRVVWQRHNVNIEVNEQFIVSAWNTYDEVLKYFKNKRDALAWIKQQPLGTYDGFNVSKTLIIFNDRLEYANETIETADA